MSPDERALAWAAEHHSIITREVARRSGLSDRQIRLRVSTGRWRPLRSGVWSPAGVMSSPMQDLAAAVLGLPAVASHLSSAWLLGVVDEPPSRPEVTVELRAGHHDRSVRLHRTTDLLRRDTQTVRGLRTTNAVRTCIDLAARMEVDELERVIERARHRRLVHLDPLIVRFLQLARPGRDGIAAVRQVLHRMDPSLEPAESDLETLLLQVLREHGVELPVRQHQVCIDGRHFRIDVCYPDRRIAIEGDGFTDHGLRAMFESDRERQNLLVLDGWTVLRFTWRQICRQPSWVAEQIARALDAARSTQR
jgi:very-short-patch-repair endonuclease